MNSSGHTRAVCLLALVAIAACVPPSANSTAYKALPPKASADSVQVFTDVRPERPHEELGLIGGTYTESTSTSERARIFGRRDRLEDGAVTMLSAATAMEFPHSRYCRRGHLAGFVRT
jgi:hypothetical protein